MFHRLRDMRCTWTVHLRDRLMINKETDLQKYCIDEVCQSWDQKPRTSLTLRHLLQQREATNKTTCKQKMNGFWEPEHSLLFFQTSHCFVWMSGLSLSIGDMKLPYAKNILNTGWTVFFSQSEVGHRRSATSVGHHESPNELALICAFCFNWVAPVLFVLTFFVCTAIVLSHQQN